MSEHVETVAPAPRAAWFGLIGPAVAFVIHELVSAVLSSVLCARGPDFARPMLWGLSAGAVVLSGVAAGLAISGYRRAARAAKGSDAMTRDETLLLSAAFLGVTMTAGLIFASLPSLMLMRDVCEAWR